MKTILYLTPEELKQDPAGILADTNGVELKCHSLPSAGWPSASDTKLIEVLEDADAIVTQRVSLSPGLIDKAGKAVALVHAGEGSGGIDLEAARRNGIYVSSVPDYATESFVKLTMNVAEKYFERTGAEVSGRTPRLGVVGIGSVGGRVAAAASKLGWEVLANDPYASDEAFRKAEADRAELNDLLGSCAVVTLHVPRTNETRGLIDAAALDLMKEGAYLINTSDPAVVDMEALLARLEAADSFSAAVGAIGSRTPGDVANRADGMARTDALTIFETDFAERADVRRRALVKACEIATACLNGKPPSHLLIDPALPRMISNNN